METLFCNKKINCCFLRYNCTELRDCLTFVLIAVSSSWKEVHVIFYIISTTYLNIWRNFYLLPVPPIVVWGHQSFSPNVELICHSGGPCRQPVVVVALYYDILECIWKKIKTNICRHLIAKSEKCLAKRRREECVEDRVDARVGVRKHVASDLISGLVDFFMDLLLVGFCKRWSRPAGAFQWFW